MIKRGRDQEDGISSIEDSSEVAKCLIQISSRWAPLNSRKYGGGAARIFNCKTCGRAFSSFQALGGHRASHHKKPRLSESENISEAVIAKVIKAKTIHECSICGIRFGLGQALGGHMRRHRLELKGGVVDAVAVVDDGLVSDEQAAKMVPILMRSLSKRIMCMDLNLTPLENDLQALFGKKTPRVDCKLV